MIALETEKGVQAKFLKPGEAPAAEFTVVDDKALTAYEYCNLHGLWKKDI
jgi:superoxide reductase